MTTMNPEIKTLWTATLRSGEYPQTEGSLRRTERFGSTPAGYCCLGVLCELAVKAGVLPPGVDVDGVVKYPTVDADGREHLELALLPREVTEWAGLESSPGLTWWENGDEKGLPSENDSGMTFTEIADIIEENL